MTPTAIRDTVGCNCSCNACAREREKKSVGEERGKRDRKRDISGGRVGEKAREATVNGCVHCTLFPCPTSVLRSVISETSAPRMYIYVIFTHVDTMYMYI